MCRGLGKNSSGKKCEKIREVCAATATMKVLGMPNTVVCFDLRQWSDRFGGGGASGQRSRYQMEQCWET